MRMLVELLSGLGARAGMAGCTTSAVVRDGPVMKKIFRHTPAVLLAMAGTERHDSWSDSDARVGGGGLPPSSGRLAVPARRKRG